jgi:hypothetical protein
MWLKRVVIRSHSPSAVRASKGIFTFPGIGVWSGLEAKALEWLAQVWPGEVGKSVGSAVLGAIKVV